MVALTEILKEYGNAKIGKAERMTRGEALSRLYDKQGKEKAFEMLRKVDGNPELMFYLAGMLYHLKDVRFLDFLKSYETNYKDDVTQSEISLAIKSMEGVGYLQ